MLINNATQNKTNAGMMQLSQSLAIEQYLRMENAIVMASF